MPIEEASGLEVFSNPYNVILCDVWGVIHNGVEAFGPACEALQNFRQNSHGTVILLTNAPRPYWWIERQLDGLNVSRDVYDAIVTSGDVTRHALETSGKTKVYALGPDKDTDFYNGLPIDLVSADEAELVSITGLIDDETETPDDYGEMLTDFKKRGLSVICANPDLVVERGDKLVYCGGALAERYREMGGSVSYFGKPHAPIYKLAIETSQKVTNLDPDKIRPLAIGDGVNTDVKGANDAGIDCLFVTGGIHSAEDGPLSNPTPQSVFDFLNERNRQAKGFMPTLKW